MKNVNCEVLSKYLLKDDRGEIRETPEELFRRVARAAAENPADEQEFFSMMADLYFLPNSPTLANAGRSKKTQLAACYVLPVEDSMAAIFDALKWTALIQQSGGGTGFNFSRLRPEGSLVRGSGGRASGPVSFMRLFDAATDAISQGGMRRGANMAVMEADHPDIMKFVRAKRSENNGLKNFNLSVLVTDEQVRSTNILDILAESAWNGGEPGVLFKDAINRTNPCPEFGELNATNPCGETPLLPFEACNLGSLNLSRMLKNGDAEIDFERLERTASAATRFLDRIISINNYPLPQITRNVLRTRKVGLGVFGFAEMLFKLRVPYDSEEAIRTAGEIMSRIRASARETSETLGKLRGCYEGGKRRNATLTCVAPTGTLSLIANTTGGIEPVFSLVYERKIGDRPVTVVNETYAEAAKKVSKEGANLSELRKIFVSALDVSPEHHVRMQAEFQKHTDLAVSKTVNLPNSATVEDVKKVYMLAHELGCKGVTVFRDGCLSEQVLSATAKCPVCGLPLIKSEGCTKCSACSYGWCSL